MKRLRISRTRVVYVTPMRANSLLLAGRVIASRLPGIGLIAGIVLLFWRDPVWPYHLLTRGVVADFYRLLTDSAYRSVWASHWMAVFVVIFCLLIVLSVAFKMAVWNKMFKTLKVRSRYQEDKVETELGRVYWIEGWSGAWALGLGKAILKGLHIADVRIGLDPRRHYRTVRENAPVALAITRVNGNGKERIDYVQPERPRFRRRTIFYKANFWPPINPISPHRSMHRLIVEVPDSAITVHDGTTVLVEGTNPKRDLSEDYPTFYLTSESNEFIPLDLVYYKDALDGDIKGGTYTTNIASQMDTFLLKDQRKFQEISVPVNQDMAKLVRRVEP